MVFILKSNGNDIPFFFLSTSGYVLILSNRKLNGMNELKYLSQPCKEIYKRYKVNFIDWP